MTLRASLINTGEEIEYAVVNHTPSPSALGRVSDSPQEHLMWLLINTRLLQVLESSVYIVAP